MVGEATGGEQSGGDEEVRVGEVSCGDERVPVGDTVHDGEDKAAEVGSLDGCDNAAQGISLVDGKGSMRDGDRGGREVLGAATASSHQVLDAKR